MYGVPHLLSLNCLLHHANSDRIRSGMIELAGHVRGVLVLHTVRSFALRVVHFDTARRFLASCTNITPIGINTERFLIALLSLGRSHRLCADVGVNNIDAHILVPAVNKTNVPKIVPIRSEASHKVVSLGEALP